MLTPQQVALVELLATGMQHKQIADHLGVSRSTLQRWMRLDLVRDSVVSRRSALIERREEANEAAVLDAAAQIRDLVPAALAAVRRILLDDEARPSDRLRAAETVLRRVVPELSAVTLSAAVEVTTADRVRLMAAAAELSDADLGVQIGDA